MCEWIAESTLSVQKYTLVAVSPAQKPLRLIPEAGQPPFVCVLHAHVGGRGSCLCPWLHFPLPQKECVVFGWKTGASPAADVPSSELSLLCWEICMDTRHGAEVEMVMSRVTRESPC